MGKQLTCNLQFLVQFQALACGEVVQLVEHWLWESGVAGSNPVFPTMTVRMLQSMCLKPEGYDHYSNYEKPVVSLSVRLSSYLITGSDPIYL